MVEGGYILGGIYWIENVIGIITINHIGNLISHNNYFRDEKTNMHKYMKT